MSNNSLAQGHNLASIANQNAMKVLSVVQHFSNASEELILNIIEEGNDKLQKLNDSIMLKRDNSKRLRGILAKFQEDILSNETAHQPEEEEEEKSDSSEYINKIIDMQQEQTEELTSILKKIKENMLTFSRTFLSTTKLSELEKSLEELEIKNKNLTQENEQLRSNLANESETSSYLYR